MYRIGVSDFGRKRCFALFDGDKALPAGFYAIDMRNAGKVNGTHLFSAYPTVQLFGVTSELPASTYDSIT